MPPVRLFAYHVTGFQSCTAGPRTRSTTVDLPLEEKMAHSIRRVIARKGQLPSLTWTAISARLSSTQPMYPNAQYTCKMPDDVDYHYPKLGNRDVVGHGLTGEINFGEIIDMPFPAVRFKENTPEILALREKAKGDWKNLTLEEKKTLYRADFCQTITELTAPTGEWRTVWATVFFGTAITLWLTIFSDEVVYPEKVRTLSKEWQEATVVRKIQEGEGHLTGVASLWDYEKGQWK